MCVLLAILKKSSVEEMATAWEICEMVRVGWGVIYLLRRELSLLNASIYIYDLVCKDQIEQLLWIDSFHVSARYLITFMMMDGHFKRMVTSSLVWWLSFLMASWSLGLIGGGVELQEKESKRGGRRKLERQINALVLVSLGLFFKALMKADSR